MSVSSRLVAIKVTKLQFKEMKINETTIHRIQGKQEQKVGTGLTKGKCLMKVMSFWLDFIA